MCEGRKKVRGGLKKKELCTPDLEEGISTSTREEEEEKEEELDGEEEKERRKGGREKEICNEFMQGSRS
jgi:hypothetical protein